MTQFVHVNHPTEPGKYLLLELISTTNIGVVVVNPQAVAGPDWIIWWSQMHPLEAFVRQFYQLWNVGNMEAVAKRIHENYQGDLTIGAAHIKTDGRAGFMADRQRGAAALRNVHIEVMEITIPDGTDNVVEVATRLTAEQIAAYNGVGKAGDTFLADSRGTWTIIDNMIATNREIITAG